MSYTHRLTSMYASTSHASASNNTSTSSSLRQPSQSILQTRIAAKRAELENLRALRDLSANLASQLSALEEKLGTLKDGAQSVALVLANWENVLRAINMAAMKVPQPADEEEKQDPSVDEGDPDQTSHSELKQELPVPLVRIPIQPKDEDTG